MDITFLKYFASFIEEELGIIYSENNFFQLENRLEEVSRLLKLSGVNELYERNKDAIDKETRQLLIDVSTNNETSFFRDFKVFQAIEKVIEERLEGEKLSFWSAASSSGQEAISVSIMMSELIARLDKKIDYNILGTDISTRILNRAKEGLYSDLEVSRGLNTELRDKYFKKANEEKWAVNRNVFKNIHYECLNLKNPLPQNFNFDVVFCRNVLIYQNLENKIKILDKIAKTIKPNGYLVLGSGESLIGVTSHFKQLLVEGAVLYQKEGDLNF